MKEAIISEEKLENILERACAAKARIWIKTSKNDSDFLMNAAGLNEKSIILNGNLSEDQLNRLQKVESFLVWFGFKGQGVFTFETHCLEKEALKDNVCLIHRPLNVSHTQRRQAFRVWPAATLQLDCLKIGQMETKDIVKVENISLLGACISFPKKAEITNGAIIKDIQLDIYDGTSIAVSGKICRQWMVPKGRFFVGLEWIGLTREEEIIIRDYISNAQREMKKVEQK